jgi:hypothetical protein
MSVTFQITGVELRREAKIEQRIDYYAKYDALHLESNSSRRLHVLTLTRAGHVPGEIAGMVSPAVNEKTIRRDVLALNGKVEHV